MPGPTRRGWQRWIGLAPTEKMGGLVGPSAGRLGSRPGGFAVGPEQAPKAKWSLLYGREGRVGGGGAPDQAVEERRWTGIEPARRGSPVSAALKAVGPTRRPDTSNGDSTPSGAAGLSPAAGPGLGSPAMKKLLLLAILVALGVVAAKKVRASN